MFFYGALIMSLVFFSEGKICPKNEIEVINGNDAQKGQFPWQVELMLETTENDSIFCSGAFISNNWVLTSASCINKVKRMTVIYGTNDLGNNANTIKTKSHIVHEDFDNNTQQNDVGLVELESRVIFDETTKAICLSEDVIGDGVNVTIAGWGHSNNDNINITPILQYVNVSTIKNTECAEVFGRDIVTSTVLCTHDSSLAKGPCINDGGAPLIINADTDPKHVGIFSFIGENGCEKNFPAGYTRTASYLDWIKNKTGVGVPCK
ncbi:brachyurin-like [Tribolium madens]|uniref:brachyurin-like n=1 Tax=Tribolium madens TaxID=41895 RepID=UPI001CF756B4|nr:brachyurin-like [Tribolium madens]